MSGIGSTYKYKRYMRDGTVEERTGVIRSRTKSTNAKALEAKKKKENKGGLELS